MRKTLLWTLAAAFLAGLAGCSCSSDSKNKTEQNLTYIAADFFAAVIVRPQEISQSPLLAGLPQDDLAARTIDRMGIDPRKIEQVTLLFAPREEAEGPAHGVGRGGLPFSYGIILRFAEPIEREAMLKEMFKKTGGVREQAEPLEGKKIYRVGETDNSDGLLIHLPDDEKTILVGDSTGMRSMLSADGEVSPLTETLGQLDADNDLIMAITLDPIRKMIKEATDEAEGAIPSNLQKYTTLPDQVKSASLTVNLDGDPLAEIIVVGPDAESAAKLEKLANEGVKETKDLYDKMRDAVLGGVPQGKGETVGTLIDALLRGISVSQDGEKVTIRLKRPDGLADVVKIFGEAIDEGRTAPARARRMNDLKEISMAMIMYYTMRNKFPPAAAARKPGGQPVSWRVRILRHLGEKALYEEYRFDEPWGSEHNRELQERMPEVFRGGRKENDGKTSVMVFTGEAAPFDGEKPLHEATIPDGMSNTIMIVEAGPDKAVPWTKPEDLPFDPHHPAAALGNVPENGFPAAFFDGSVRWIKKDIAAETLRRLIDPDDGEPIDFSEF